MSESKVSAKNGSTAVGGDVNAPIVNVNADGASTVNVILEQHVECELPSFLGRVIAVFSQQSLSDYGLGARRSISEEVLTKLAYNSFPQEHRIIKEHNRYSLLLEKAYLGVEQTNADARFLVRRKAGLAYDAEVQIGCKEFAAKSAAMIDYVRANVDVIIQRVINRLLEDYKKSSDVKVEQEIADLAVSMIVADAVIECEVLERP
jgi:hypothetical protein